MATSPSRKLALAAARGCASKKATDIVVLDVREITSIADYFVICSAGSERQARAIADDLRVSMRNEGIRQLGLEGASEGKWTLQDFGDVVVHVFHESQREFYDLEGLWADAKRVRWQPKAKKA